MDSKSLELYEAAEKALHTAMLAHADTLITPKADPEYLAMNDALFEIRDMLCRYTIGATAMPR